MKVGETRKCRLCLQDRQLSDFSSNGRKKAVENRCKHCIRKSARLIRELKKTAPLKPDKCQCCGNPALTLCLDHCHVTKKFRGWICAPCNRGIGQLGDNIESLQKALIYLGGGQ